MSFTPQIWVKKNIAKVFETVVQADKDSQDFLLLFNTYSVNIFVVCYLHLLFIFRCTKKCFLSVTIHINSSVARCLINVVCLTLSVLQHVSLSGHDEVAFFE